MRRSQAQHRIAAVPEAAVAARRLAIPARQVYRFIDEGELDAFRVDGDGDVMLRAEDVARHHDAGRA